MFRHRVTTALTMPPQAHDIAENFAMPLPEPAQQPSLTTCHMLYGTPCLECEARIKALFSGHQSFIHVPEGIRIEFAYMIFLDDFFVGGFRVIRRNSDVPAITHEDLMNLLERNLHTHS